MIDSALRPFFNIDITKVQVGDKLHLSYSYLKHNDEKINIDIIGYFDSISSASIQSVDYYFMNLCNGQYSKTGKTIETVVQRPFNEHTISLNLRIKIDVICERLMLETFDYLKTI